MRAIIPRFYYLSSGLHFVSVCLRSIKAKSSFKFVTKSVTFLLILLKTGMLQLQINRKWTYWMWSAASSSRPSMDTWGSFCSTSRSHLCHFCWSRFPFCTIFLVYLALSSARSCDCNLDLIWLKLVTFPMRLLTLWTRKSDLRLRFS